jgi:hypothetical protein
MRRHVEGESGQDGSTKQYSDIHTTSPLSLSLEKTLWRPSQLNAADWLPPHDYYFLKKSIKIRNIQRKRE